MAMSQSVYLWEVGSRSLVSPLHVLLRRFEDSAPVATLSILGWL